VKKRVQGRNPTAVGLEAFSRAFLLTFFAAKKSKSVCEKDKTPLTIP